MSFLSGLSDVATAGAGIYETIEATRARVKAAKSAAKGAPPQVVFAPAQSAPASPMSTQTMLLIGGAAVAAFYFLRKR